MKSIRNKTYTLVNLCLLLALVLLFFLVKFSVLDVRCVYQEQGMVCMSCGTTRALHALLDFRWAEATTRYVPFKISLFFVIQFALRILVMVALRLLAHTKQILRIDIAISILLFCWAFYDLVLNLFR